jgi:hypothetical protein
MCFGMICKLKERGTAFLRRLAIQFSKTELNPSTEKTALEPSPDRRGSREDNRSASRRAATYHRRPECVKRKARNQRFELPPDARESTSTSTRLTRQLLVATPQLAVRTEGRCFYPLAGIPSTKRQVLLLLPPWNPLARGRLLPATRQGVKACL